MPEERSRIRCLVADDHPAIVSAVADFLESEGLEVVAWARDGEEALAKIAATVPAIAIVDVQMPGCSGVDVARRAPAAAVVLYTGHADRGLLADAVDAGARGFVLKEAPLADLLRAVQTVAAGGTYVDPVLAGPIAAEAARQGLPALTRRERDVLRLLADGRSNDEIGKALFISAETVRTHIRKAMRKLDADTRTQAVATAIRQSLIA
jgi:DNA-binding NarL/FixJ family response regulator